MRARHFCGLAAALGICLIGTAVQAAPPPAGGAGNDTGAAVDRTAPAPPDSIRQQAAAPADELLMSRERYFYSSFARRDPFASLLKGKFASTGEGDLLDVGELSLVGVVWGENDKFAVVQDKRNNVHTLRVGDRVVNGKVTEITRTSLTVQHYFFGETANVTIQISEGEGAK